MQDPKAAEDPLRRKRPHPPSGTTPRADPQTAALLGRTIPELELARAKLQEVLQFVGEYSNLSIVTDWRALEKFGIDSSTTVTVTARKVRVSEALRLILTDVAKGQAKLGFEGVSGLVVISTTEGLAALRNARQFEQTRRRLAGTADRAVWKKLDGGPPEIHFKDFPLKDALAFFSQVCGVRFEMNWEALGALGAHETSRFTLRLRGASTATALWVMFLKFDKARDLAVTVKNGAVTLAKPGSVPTRPTAGNARPTPPPRKPTPPRKPSPPKPPPDAETAATRMLRLAALYRTNKKTDQAIELYRKIVKEYPDTKAADTARAHLAVLDNR